METKTFYDSGYVGLTLHIKDFIIDNIGIIPISIVYHQSQTAVVSMQWVAVICYKVV